MSEFVLSQMIYKHKCCEICLDKNGEASMVLCDRCEDAYHIGCIELPSVPEGTWICVLCQIDVAQHKQQQLIRKRPVSSFAMDECRACKNKKTDSFLFEMGEERVLIEARDVSLVICAYCQQSFHNLCFSDRPYSINCRACEDLIRQSIPKGHQAFKNFMRQSSAKISHRLYQELTNDFRCPEMAEFSLPHLRLVPPKQLEDWKLVVSYEASLCYALLTRDMIYSQNLVVEASEQKFKIIREAHSKSIEMIYKLHRLDQIAYEQFKSRMQFGFIPPIQVRQDRRKGFYLVSTAFIPKNTILAEYAGELITARESLNMINNENIFTLIRNPRSRQSLDIAPSQFGNIAIFISGVNNSDKDAGILQNVRAMKFSYRGINRLIFTALRDIRPKETLYLNYNGDKAIAEYPTNNFVH